MVSADTSAQSCSAFGKFVECVSIARQICRWFLHRDQEAQCLSIGHGGLRSGRTGTFEMRIESAEHLVHRLDIRAIPGVETIAQPEDVAIPSDGRERYRVEIVGHESRAGIDGARAIEIRSQRRR